MMRLSKTTLKQEGRQLGKMRRPSICALSVLCLMAAVSGVRAEVHSGDITAAIRDAGLSMGVAANGVTLYEGSSAVSALFDGVYGTQRVLVKNNQYYLDNGFALTCTIPDAFADGEPVIVNSITWEISANISGATTNEWAGMKARVPREWTIEGWNAENETWDMLSEVTGYENDYYQNTYNSDGTKTLLKSGKLVFDNTQSYRKYRLTIKKTFPEITGYGDWSVQLSEIKLGGFYGSGTLPVEEVLDPEKYEQDITKLVRESGNLRKTTANFTTRNTTTMSFEQLFNGVYGQNDRMFADYGGTGTGPVAKAYETNGACRIEYEIGSLFRPGEEIVVSSYQIMANANSTYAQYRLPRSWRLEAYDETSADWQLLDEQTDATVIASEVDGVNVYVLNVPRVPVVKNARRFRLSILSQQWSRDPERWPVDQNNFRALQIGQIRFFGYVGPRATEIAPRDGRLDITENIRRVGNAYRTVSCNVEQIWSWAADRIFDGSSLEGLDIGEDRYFSKNWGVVKAAFEAGGMTVEYDISESYSTNADIIVNGYEIMTGRFKTRSFERMPYCWKFQGYDAVSNQWETLDEYVNFHQWETNRLYKGCLNGEWLDNQLQVGHAFTFQNNKSFRKYRLLITQLYVQSRPEVTLNEDSTVGSSQISEVRLFGYVGDNLAGGTLGTTDDAALPFAFTTTQKNGYGKPYFDYELRRSEITQNISGTVTNLFNGNDVDRVIWTITDHRPLDIECDLSGTFALQEMVLTNYSLCVSGEWANRPQRLPARWDLMAWADGRWVKIDSRSVDPYTQWSTKSVISSGKTWDDSPYLSIPLTENKLSSHRYQLRIHDVGDKLNDGYHLQLGEISLAGIWGVGIAEPCKPKQFMIILR